MTSKKVTAPGNPEAVTTHKEDRKQRHLTSSTDTIAWRPQVIAWYAGGPQPTPAVMMTARFAGISDRQPSSPRDKVRALALTGFDAEGIIAAVPELNPLDIVDLIDSVPPAAFSIFDLHLQGYTPVEIEELVDVSRPTVYYWLGKLNLKPHKRSRDELTTRQRAQIVRAYQLGGPMASIARRFGVSYDQVRYAVAKAA